MSKKIKVQEIKNINKNFNKIIQDLENISTNLETQMPLVAKSLSLTVEIIKIYKEAFISVSKKTK